MHSLLGDLWKRAQESGFDAVGIADPAAIGAAGHRFGAFLQRGWQGDMAWLAANADRRSDPRTLWPDVQSIIMLGMNYGPEEDPLAALDRQGQGAISVYAQGKDYHDIVKRKLKATARWLVAETGCEVKVFVDTAPVLEKPLAAAAGLGWQGKHTNLVSRTFGSWLFLGCIFTTLPLPAAAPETDHCGRCRRCLDICPTHAFPAPYRLDARRCISYLTIEHKGHIPAEFRRPMGNRIYGCDDCLAVCPWNKFAQAANEAAFSAPDIPGAFDLLRLAAMDDADFRQRFRGSPVKRTGRARFVRNVLIAIGNSKPPAARPVVETCLQDPSPLVRAMAVWALREIIDEEEFDRMRTDRAAGETDAAVLAEWQSG